MTKDIKSTGLALWIELRDIQVHTPSNAFHLKNLSDEKHSTQFLILHVCGWSQRCADTQQLHGKCHGEVWQLLTTSETRLSECAALDVTSLSKCVQQQNKAEVCHRLTAYPSAVLRPTSEMRFEYGVRLLVFALQ